MGVVQHFKLVVAIRCHLWPSLVLDTVASIFHYSRLYPLVVLASDNNSRIGPVVEKQFPQVKTFVSPHKWGWGPGLYGLLSDTINWLDEMPDLTYDHFLSLDYDTLAIGKDFDGILMREIAAHPQVGLTGSHVPRSANWQYRYGQCREIIAKLFNGSPFPPPTYLPGESCFTGSTRVALLDGTNPTFTELVKRYPDGETFDVYSIGSGGSIIPGVAQVRETRAVMRTVRVHLDNKEVVECTPDHLWLKRDGTFCRADELGPGDSLMPLYRRLQEISKSGKYEQVFDPGLEQWRFTHRVVAEHSGLVDAERRIVHHRNFRRLDNRRENLQGTTGSEHAKIHCEHMRSLWDDPVIGSVLRQKVAEAGRKTLAKWREENPEAQREVGRRNGKLHGKKNLQKWMDEGGGREESGRRLAEFNRSEKGRAQSAENGRKGDREGKRKGGKYKRTKKHSEATSRRNRNRTYEKIPCGICGKLLKSINSSHLRTHGLTVGEYREKYGPVQKVNNHTVVSVEIEDTDYPKSVYCLRVPGFENFALSAGVFVHNCLGGFMWITPKCRKRMKELGFFKNPFRDIRGKIDLADDPWTALLVRAAGFGILDTKKLLDYGHIAWQSPGDWRNFPARGLKVFNLAGISRGTNKTQELLTRNFFRRLRREKFLLQVRDGDP